MKAYRCYFLDQQSRIAGVEVIECADDVEARSTAEILLRQRAHLAAEVWDRQRLVARMGRVLART